MSPDAARESVPKASRLRGFPDRRWLQPWTAGEGQSEPERGRRLRPPQAKALLLDDYERVDAGLDGVRWGDTGRQVGSEEVGGRTVEDDTSAFGRGLMRVPVAVTRELGRRVDHGAGCQVSQREDDLDRDAMPLHPDDLTGPFAVLAALHRDGNRAQAGAVELDQLLARRGRTGSHSRAGERAHGRDRSHEQGNDDSPHVSSFVGVPQRAIYPSGLESQLKLRKGAVKASALRFAEAAARRSPGPVMLECPRALPEANRQPPRCTSGAHVGSEDARSGECHGYSSGRPSEGARQDELRDLQADVDG